MALWSTFWKFILKPVCCKRRQKLVPDQCTSYWLHELGTLKDLKDSKLIINESKLFPWSSRMSLVPFRTFREPLVLNPVTGQELFLPVSYSKPALVEIVLVETVLAADPMYYEIMSEANNKDGSFWAPEKYVYYYLGPQNRFQPTVADWNEVLKEYLSHTMTQTYVAFHASIRDK